jgi:mono-ADP-ribosyltransferase sirtuin 6
MDGCRDYNSRLKPVRYKGLCGDPEIVEDERALAQKVRALASLIQNSQRVVIFTGAGISTSCGIPDFRGPNGVWTKELRGADSEPVAANSFDTAKPSYTHFAIACLLHAGIFTHVVSQNVDGLHIRSGVPESKLCELHGNIFKEYCEDCGAEYIRDKDVGGMGLKYTGNQCESTDCFGVLRDMAVDWDTELPSGIFTRAHHEIDCADVVLCLGTSLRIRPAGNMPLRVTKEKKKRGGRAGALCIVNLQKTHLDKVATVRISHYCDEVMRRLCHELGVELKSLSELSGDRIEDCYKVREDSCLLDRVLRYRKRADASAANSIKGGGSHRKKRSRNAASVDANDPTVTESVNEETRSKARNLIGSPVEQSNVTSTPPHRTSTRSRKPIERESGRDDGQSDLYW